MPNKQKTRCKRWRSCAEVPNGQVMPGCRPAYTSKGSKNWSRCNMAEWGGDYRKANLKFCKGMKTRKCKTIKHHKPNKDQVDAQELHNKMPYIWRHLGTSVRNKIVKLARQPLNEINL